MKQHVVTLFSAVISLSSIVAAQGTSDSVKYQLDPVTVTAMRFAEPWLEVPLALTVIPVAGASAGKGYGLDELLTGVPGVLAQSRYGNQDVRITIRGFGSRGAGAKSNAGTTRGIRVLLDGFPETEPDGRTSMDLVDISGAGSVEVVRSNASSVWGNAAGGVVNVLSNTMFDTPYACVQSLFGSYGFRKEMLQIGAKLDAGRFFLSLGNTNSNGWRYHSGSTQTLLNTGIVSSLGERTSLGVYLTGTSNLFRIPGPLSRQQFDSLAVQADSSFIRRDERRINRIGRLGTTLSYDLDQHNTVSSSAFIAAKNLQRSERNRYRDFTRYHVGGNLLYRNASMMSHEMKNTLLLGLDEAYQDGAIHFYDLTSNGDRGTTLVANKREGANNVGAYLQDELAFGERVSAILGARYDNITYYYDDFVTPSLNDRKSFERVTPKAGITYRLSPVQSVYANLGGGVEVPAGNEVDPVPTFGTDTVRLLNPLLEPIRSTTVEVGTKHILSLGSQEHVGSLTYDVALYWLEVTNDLIPFDDGGFYLTAGRTQRMGAEIGAALRLDNGLMLEGSTTLSRNTYREYLIDSVYFDRLLAGHVADLKEKKMSGVPQFFYTFGMRYAPPSLGSAYLKAGVQGVGEYFADDRNQYIVPAYTVVNVGAGMEHYNVPGSSLYLRAFVGVNNLTDQRYAASAWINPQLNASDLPVFLEPGLPRNVVGSISLGVTL
jgi:iron complex outermembrane receptor protein